MKPARAADYVDHMLQAARLARGYTEDMSREDFLSDSRTQHAVIFNLQIVGEAATKLSNEHGDFIAQHPQIAWKAMRGMRNRLARGYFDINLDVVWETVQKALPELVEQLSAIGDRPSA